MEQRQVVVCVSHHIDGLAIQQVKAGAEIDNGADDGGPDSGPAAARTGAELAGELSLAVNEVLPAKTFSATSMSQPW